MTSACRLSGVTSSSIVCTWRCMAPATTQFSLWHLGHTKLQPRNGTHMLLEAPTWPHRMQRMVPIFDFWTFARVERNWNSYNYA